MKLSDCAVRLRNPNKLNAPCPDRLYGSACLRASSPALRDADRRSSPQRPTCACSDWLRTDANPPQFPTRYGLRPAPSSSSGEGGLRCAGLAGKLLFLQPFSISSLFGGAAGSRTLVRSGAASGFRQNVDTDTTAPQQESLAPFVVALNLQVTERTTQTRPTLTFVAGAATLVTHRPLNGKGSRDRI
jgi:hypothetical protein